MSVDCSSPDRHFDYRDDDDNDQGDKNKREEKRFQIAHLSFCLETATSSLQLVNSAAKKLDLRNLVVVMLMVVMVNIMMEI